MTAQASFTILRLRQVLSRVGVSRSTLYSWIQQGKFPKPIKLGGTERSASGWIEAEVNAWVESKIKASRG